MGDIKVRDVKKALRLSGWVLVMIDGNRFLYKHPAVPRYFTICGKDNDTIRPNTLRIIEHQVGLCLGRVFA